MDTFLENDFIWSILIVVIYMKWRKRFELVVTNELKEIKSEINADKNTDSYSWTNKFLYISNGAQIPAPHFVYYMVLLGLNDISEFHLQLIDRAYLNILNEISVQRSSKKVKVDISGLKAARDYLKDRYCYVAYLN